MFDGLGTELNTVIDNLCNKFGVTVDTLLPELCKFKVYEAIGYLYAFGIMTAFALICFVGFLIISKKWKLDSIEICFGMSVIFVALMILIGCISYQTYQLVIWKNAPTGAAVNYVIQQLKNR